MAMHVTIDGYDSLEQIGVGGMAAVYRARKTSIDKVVAIKVLFPYLASDQSFIERFKREARAAARIQHENIVNVIDFGESDGSYFIVMEHYEGHTLEDILKERNHLPLDIAVHILLEVCFGLDAAHSHDTVHRDIKPGNVIFTRQGGIKIADFGLAKKSDATSLITQEGKVIGTPAYMSPEQAAGEDVGPQSDIFSLGVVAYELFGQQRPFAGKSYSEVLEKIQTFEPSSVATINPLVQPDFEAIIAKMLEKDRDKRYQSCKDVIADLENAMEKFRIARDRRRLVSYINGPEAYEKAFKEKTVNRCLSQGAFYMKKGESRFEEAILEFQRILYLDPGNERARKNLERIQKQRGQSRTVTVVTTPSPTRTGGGRRRRRESKNRPETRKKGKRSVSVVASGAPGSRGSDVARRVAGVITASLVVATVGWFSHRLGLLPEDLLNASGNTPPVLSSPKKLSVRGGDQIEFVLQSVDTDGDSVRYYCDDLPHGAVLGDAGDFRWKVGVDQAGQHKIKFYADDGTSSSVSETTILVEAPAITVDFTRVGTVRADAGKRFSRALQASSSSGEPVTFALEQAPEGMRLEGNRLVWRPGKKANGTFEAVVTATDGFATERQTVTVRVRSVAEQEAEVAKVLWELPEKSNVYIDGQLKEAETTRFRADLPRGRYTLRAELMDGLTGWVESLELEPGENVKLQAPSLEYGTLSVYFLGGVGELLVNGKLFKRQPPFTAVKVPVGEHEVSCRMASEAKGREVVITVERGRETIVEYEIGTDPVVKIE